MNPESAVENLLQHRDHRDTEGAERKIHVNRLHPTGEAPGLGNPLYSLGFSLCPLCQMRF